MSRQKIMRRDRTWEEFNKSAETKKVNVVTRFVSWMSTLGRTCRDMENRKKAEILSRQEIKEQYRKNTATYQFMLRHSEK